jgi:hypothetical protein
MSDWSDGVDLSGGGNYGFDPSMLPPVQDPFGPDLTPLPTIPGSNDPGGAFYSPGAGLTDTSGLNSSLLNLILKGAGAATGGAKGGSANPFSMTNGDGSLNWSSLIPLLASVFGGATAYNATKKGSSDMVNALNSANSQITSLLGPGGAMGNFAPYQTIGQMATGKLGQYNFKPLAPQFKSAVKG